MIAMVIPCYKVKKHIMNVLAGVGNNIDSIYVVDDKCPEGTGKHVLEKCKDGRVKVIFHENNSGVGAAVITGFGKAMADGASIIVKVDGDNQMDLSLVDQFIKPIIKGEADYTKGNRFYDLELLSSMPKTRVFGNSLLSFLNKVTSGYWDIMDPTNGYTAIHSKVLKLLPLEKIEKGYFFESDMLFRLNLVRAVVKDIPLPARYAGEESNLNIAKVIFQFPAKHLTRIFKRIFYNYYLRDFNAGTVEMTLGLFMAAFGVCYGLWRWYLSYISRVPTTSGTVMISVLPILIGGHLIISAINYDITNVPKNCLHKLLH